MNTVQPDQRDVANELTIGLVAARSGVPDSTIRFYEKKGLIQSGRSRGNQRRYPREILRRLAVIKIAQRVGIPLSEIGKTLSCLPKGRPPTAKNWTKMSLRWRAELDERINKLVQLRDQLSNCIGCGCLSLGSCPLYNPGDKLAKQGPGPRLLDPT